MARGRLRVEGASILDVHGNRVVLRGLGLGELASVKEQMRWNQAYFENAKAWGAELVRLPINPQTYLQAPAQTLADLDDAVRWSKRSGLYLIIDYHIIGNLPQGLFIFDGCASTEAQMRDFWATVAPRYANEPTVAFYELYNEPASLDYQGGVWAFADWRAMADDLVRIVRAGAPETIPLVAGFEFANDFSSGGIHPYDSPNIALAVHPYPGLARTNRRAVWDAKFGYLSDRYPLVFTEVGFDPHGTIQPREFQDDLPYGREIMTYAQEKSISWTAFVFFNSRGWPMPLFSEWESLTPTISGQFFKDLLAAKSIVAAGEEGGVHQPLEPVGNGPSGMDWYPWAHAGASSVWVEPPNRRSVNLHIESSGEALAGMFAAFDPLQTTKDLTAYNQLTFEGSIAQGQRFTVTVGRQGTSYQGCSWELVGKGDSTYVVDLATPGWCGPTDCFDLQAQGVGFGNVSGSAPATMDLQIRSVVLESNSQRPALKGGIGVKGCAVAAADGGSDASVDADARD